MQNKSHALAAGLFVLLMAALLSTLAWWLTRDSSEYERYELLTTDSISGLRPQAVVNYKGVNVGRVARIGFDPTETGHVRIELEINTHTPIQPGYTYAQLGYQGITGIAHIQLDDAEAPIPSPAPGTSGLPRLPMRASPLSALADQSSLMLARADQVLAQLNQTLGEANQQRLVQLLDGLNDTVAATTTMMRGVDKHLQQLNTAALAALQSIAPLAADGQRALTTLEAAAAQIQHAAAQLQQPHGTLEQLHSAAAQLNATTAALRTQTLPALNTAATGVQTAAGSLSHMAQEISDNPQSLIWGRPQPPAGPGE